MPGLQLIHVSKRGSKERATACSWVLTRSIKNMELHQMHIEIVLSRSEKLHKFGF